MKYADRFRRGPKSKYVPGFPVGPYVVSGYVGDNDDSKYVRLECEHGVEIEWNRSYLSDLKHRKQCRCGWLKIRPKHRLATTQPAEPNASSTIR
jgi:hypothetical protein